MKSIDSSSVSQKPCPLRGFKMARCGKTEEGSGKKDNDFHALKTKNREACQYRREFILSRNANDFFLSRLLSGPKPH
jgi:hypothetical protein